MNEKLLSEIDHNLEIREYESKIEDLEKKKKERLEQLEALPEKRELADLCTKYQKELDATMENLNISRGVIQSKEEEVLWIMCAGCLRMVLVSVLYPYPCSLAPPYGFLCRCVDTRTALTPIACAKIQGHAKTLKDKKFAGIDKKYKRTQIAIETHKGAIKDLDKSVPFLLPSLRLRDTAPYLNVRVCTSPHARGFSCGGSDVDLQRHARLCMHSSGITLRWTRR
jgi:hypothetical protein